MRGQGLSPDETLASVGRLTLGLCHLHGHDVETRHAEHGVVVRALVEGDGELAEEDRGGDDATQRARRADESPDAMAVGRDVYHVAGGHANRGSVVRVELQRVLTANGVLAVAAYHLDLARRQREHAARREEEGRGIGVARLHRRQWRQVCALRHRPL